MIRVCLFTFTLLRQLSSIHTEGCDSFKNTNVSVSDGMKNEYYYVVNGCLEPKIFEGKEIRKVYFISEITRLGKDSIRDLPKLELIVIVANRLEIKLEPQAFRNVTSLRTVTMEMNNLKEIPKDVFNLVPTIRNLHLAKNKIDFIASGAFSNIKSLIWIDLADNALLYWNRDWFENCPHLQAINFNSNKISIIPRRAFASLPKLSVIDLGDNKITTIQPEAFLNVESLSYLYLQGNRLTVLDERAFPNEIYIEVLYINTNRLNYLPDKLLKKLSVSEIIMHQNPWKCPCMQRIHDWLYFTNGSIGISEVSNCKTPYDPVCVVPQGNTCQETVEKELTQRYIEHLKTLTEKRTCTYSFS
ncbi:unnamed protein product [Phaedon cochleariae]|uniref:Uncharacterized protein n=1 Tax=Phaedon cochleariae TaxID=80249 RepID=A0A9P0DP07_PHACE|nr:unnamed protein product [Phaedon cochleariae]